MALLINGLFPAFGEGVEVVVHLLAKGHLAHTELGVSDIDESNPEHGCGPTFHLCRCCSAQPPLRGIALSPPSPVQSSEPAVAVEGDVPLDDYSPRLFRPPIVAS